MLLLLGNTVAFEEMQDTEFTVIAFHIPTMGIIEMSLDSQVNETRRNRFLDKLSAVYFQV